MPVAPTPTPITIRAATAADIPALAALIERSVRILQAKDYTPSQLDSAIGSVFGIDRQLIADGTYLVAERGGALLGCGGWSKRATLYGSDHVVSKDNTLLRPGIDPARIRAFFIDPAYARQGAGTAILIACEAAAAAAGFTTLELAATLTGIPLYQRHGYVAVELTAAPLPNGEALPILRMRKALQT